MKNSINSKVKPLVVAIALAGASAGAVQAQPIVSIGGNFNVSAAASLSSALPSLSSLNTSQALNAGYSGSLDVAFPANDGDAVQSAISELMADSSSEQSLPGLSLPGVDGEASMISETAAEVTGTLDGLGDSQPSGQLGLSAVTSTASEVAARLNGAESSGGDNAGPETPEVPEDDVTPEENASDDDVADQGDAQAPNGEVFASAVTETVATARGQLGGNQGQVPNMGLIATGVSRTATEASAQLRNVEPASEEPSAPASPGIDDAEIVAAAESQSEATAVASLN